MGANPNDSVSSLKDLGAHLQIRTLIDNQGKPPNRVRFDCQCGELGDKSALNSCRLSKHTKTNIESVQKRVFSVCLLPGCRYRLLPLFKNTVYPVGLGEQRGVAETHPQA